jgi:hypothetical protein
MWWQKMVKGHTGNAVTSIVASSDTTRETSDKQPTTNHSSRFGFQIGSAGMAFPAAFMEEIS